MGCLPEYIDYSAITNVYTIKDVGISETGIYTYPSLPTSKHTWCTNIKTGIVQSAS